MTSGPALAPALDRSARILGFGMLLVSKVVSFDTMGYQLHRFVTPCGQPAMIHLQTSLLSGPRRSLTIRASTLVRPATSSWRML